MCRGKHRVRGVFPVSGRGGWTKKVSVTTTVRQPKKTKSEDGFKIGTGGGGQQKRAPVLAR